MSQSMIYAGFAKTPLKKPL